jgi:hypothetical protein
VTATGVVESASGQRLKNTVWKGLWTGTGVDAMIR